MYTGGIHQYYSLPVRIMFCLIPVKKICQDVSAGPCLSSQHKYVKHMDSHVLTLNHVAGSESITLGSIELLLFSCIQSSCAIPTSPPVCQLPGGEAWRNAHLS